MKHHDRLATLGRFSAGLAHEIRNPLGSIELFASLLKQDLSEDNEKQLLADHICNGVKNMDRIISSILLFAKSPEPSRQKCEINDLLNELLEFSINGISLIVPHNSDSHSSCFNVGILVDLCADDFFKSKINERVILITTKAKKLYTDFKFKKGDTLLFGKESAGVPQEVHGLLKNKLKIPMIDKKRSLNLSTSVAIILAESLRQLN